MYFIWYLYLKIQIFPKSDCGTIMIYKVWSVIRDPYSRSRSFQTLIWAAHFDILVRIYHEKWAFYEIWIWVEYPHGLISITVWVINAIWKIKNHCSSYILVYTTSTTAILLYVTSFQLCADFFLCKLGFMGGGTL